MIDKFKDKFIEEATDNIKDLEDALLLLENNTDDIELIERIFRAMHTLKGGGAMFGFEKLSEFTHHLENVYDLVRNKKIEITKTLLDITLESVDLLKDLLDDNKNNTDEIENIYNSIINKVNNITENYENGNKANVLVQDNKIIKKNLKSFYLYFEPNNDIFSDGTNPLFLLDELQFIGECKIFAHIDKIPEIETIEVTKCYTYWEVIITTEEDKNAITDVFIFVEDQCKLEVNEIGEFNIFLFPDIIDKITKLSIKKDDIGFEEIKKLTANIENKKVEKLDISPSGSKIAQKKKNNISSIRVASEKLDSLINRVSELITIQAHLSLFANQNKNTELEAITEEIEKISRDLRDDIFSIRLIPLETSITQFYRLVRELSNKLKKDIILKTEGTDTELDKNILEGLTEPLMHIMRNSIDHGIEDAETRIKAGKPKQGTITLKAFYSGTNIFIQVIDDGAGIDINKIKQSAIAKGFIDKNNNLNNQEILNLIFKSGFTTSQAVTDISGRGVGMDVVKQKITDIRGEVDIESTIGKGTTITIKLPLTLSIIDGLLTKIEDTPFIIPISSIEKIYAVEHTKLINTFNNIVTIENTQFPFYYLREEFDFPETTLKTEQLIIVKYKERNIGLVVDNVIGKYQAVLKSLGSFFKDNEIISGSSILGDGTVALVLDTSKIISRFSNYNNLKN